MTSQVRNRIFFGVVALLVFIGANLALVGEMATGPHRYISFGITGWLTLHRYGEKWLPQGLRWSIESISIVGLLAEVVVACLLTGMLSLILKSVRARACNGEPGAAPNGGPATSPAHSGASEGPPSVS